MKIRKVFMAEQQGVFGMCLGWGDTQAEARDACFNQLLADKDKEEQMSQQYAAEQADTALSLEVYGEPKQ